MSNKQPFRAADIVEVLDGLHQGEQWVVAVYDAARDEAYMAGWPCTLVPNASASLVLVKAADDEDHANMVAGVTHLRGELGESDPRRCALGRVLAVGGTP
jgi:hypothetical protein